MWDVEQDEDTGKWWLTLNGERDTEYDDLYDALERRDLNNETVDFERRDAGLEPYPR